MEQEVTKEHTIFQLREAADALKDLIHDMETDPEYDETVFRIDITHVYHHLNTAWNARNETLEAVTKCADADFDRWQQFPDSDNILFTSCVEEK